MKLRYIIMLGMAAMPAFLMAQNEDVIQKFSRQDLGGSARYQSMAGAMGSIGGDFSSVRQNPAGLALMRSNSDMNVTIALNSVNDKAQWVGNSNNNTKNLFDIQSFSYVAGVNRGQKLGYMFGFGMNTTGSFERNVSIGGNMPDKGYSLADYIAGYTWLSEQGRGSLFPPSNLGADNAWDNYPWFPVIGYQSGMINPTDAKGGPYHTRFTYPSGNQLVPFGPKVAEMKLFREKGDIRNFDFSFGLNYDETWFFGASFTYTSLIYKLNSQYNESFEKPNYLYLENSQETVGSGFGGSVGIIYQPVQGLKVGLSYFTPTWYYMRDQYVGYAESHTPNKIIKNGKLVDELVDDKNNPINFLKSQTPEGVTDYHLTTPGRFVASASYIFDRYGLISVDYEYQPIGHGKLSDPDFNADVYSDINKAAREDFKGQHTYRIGLELKPMQRWAIRGGYMYRTNPLNKEIWNNFEASAPQEVIIGRTQPHFTMSEGQQAYTLGTGFRFTPQLSLDLAAVFEMQNAHLYSFPTLKNINGEDINSLPPINLDSYRTSVALTLGYRF